MYFVLICTLFDRTFLISRKMVCSFFFFLKDFIYLLFSFLYFPHRLLMFRMGVEKEKEMSYSQLYSLTRMSAGIFRCREEVFLAYFLPLFCDLDPGPHDLVPTTALWTVCLHLQSIPGLCTSSFDVQLVLLHYPFSANSLKGNT